MGACRPRVGVSLKADVSSPHMQEGLSSAMHLPPARFGELLLGLCDHRCSSHQHACVLL